MPQTSTCANCLAEKANINDYYCTDCNLAVQQVETLADNEKLPMLQYRALKDQALAGQRGRGSMGSKHRPDSPFSRIDDTDFRTRMGLNT
jgi:hypothetical protein